MIGIWIRAWLSSLKQENFAEFPVFVVGGAPGLRDLSRNRRHTLVALNPGLPASEYVRGCSKL